MACILKGNQKMVYIGRESFLVIPENSDIIYNKCLTAIEQKMDKAWDGFSFIITQYESLVPKAQEWLLEYVNRTKDIDDPRPYTVLANIMGQIENESSRALATITWINKARLVAVNKELTNDVWSDRVSHQVKDFLWKEAQKALVAEKSNARDYELIAHAVYFQFRDCLKKEQKTAEEQLVPLLEAMRYMSGNKHPYASLVNAQYMCSINRKPLPEWDEWQRRYFVYTELQYAIMQGKQSVMQARKYDTATHEEAYNLLLNRAQHGDKGATIALASKQKHISSIVAVPGMCTVPSLSIPVDVHSNSILEYAKENGLYATLLVDAMVKKDDLEAPLALFGLLISAVRVSEQYAVHGDTVLYDTMLLYSALRWGVEYLERSQTSPVSETKNRVKQYVDAYLPHLRKVAVPTSEQYKDIMQFCEQAQKFQ
jgi:hypothetical protein